MLEEKFDGGMEIMSEQGFTEQDWKLFRKKIPDWQENYMDKLNQKYAALLCSNIAPSDKFWQLEKRIQEDKKKVAVVADMRRSKLIPNIIALLAEDAINMEDLDEFSDELKKRVKFILEW